MKTKHIHFTPKAKVHFMGIGGSGIAGVADLTQKMGYEVSGCDLETGGHDVKHLKNVDLVVVTPAVFYQSAKHPEVVEAKKRGILMTWQEFLGKYLQEGKKVICVAGTHGKSTTTAMVGKLLVDAGLDPLVVVGAKVPEWGGNSRFGKGKYFVIEADEFFDNFLNYSPEIIILNNIEFDHPDYFQSEKAVLKSFKKFIANLVGEKVLIVNWDDVGVKKLLKDTQKLETKILKCSLRDSPLKLKLKVLGKHNLANALGVVALGRFLRIDDQVIKQSLESFTGIGRRMELVGEAAGIKIFDDYAHHPTAIAATLEALRERYPKNRIWAVVEPHGYARTKALLALYQNVFKDADRVIIGPIFPARDKKTFGMTPGKIARVSEHRDVSAANSFDQIKKIIDREVRSGDVILVMGAGRSNLWARQLLQI